jgi:CHAT domain-containing protein
MKRGPHSTRSRLHWCPTGRFRFIPLHVAGMYRIPREDCESCFDYVISSYTPTLTILARATANARSLPIADIALLLVVEENAYRAANLPRLLDVPSESERVASCAHSHTGAKLSRIEIMSGNTVADEVALGLGRSNIAHLACHGVQDLIQALSSGFCLGDRRLSISDIMELDIKDGFLAFLSACETAKGDSKQPDQTVHLVSAMLFAGFENVIATMW